MYEQVAFLQGEAAYEALALLDRSGAEAAIEHLTQHYEPGAHEVTEVSSAGFGDMVYVVGNYRLSFRPSLDYVGLEAVIPEGH